MPRPPWIVMFSDSNPNVIYAYVRSIINRDRGNILGIFNDSDPDSDLIFIIAEVHSIDEIEKGRNLILESDQ